MHDGIGLRVAHQRAARDLDIQRLTVLAVAALALAVGAVSRHIFSFVPEIHQCGHVIIHHKYDIAAAAAVTAVRSAGRHIFLPVKGNRTVSALAGVYGDPRFIYKRCRHRKLPL